LHFFLQLNFLLGLVVCVRRLLVLEVLALCLLLISLSFQVILLNSLVFLKEFLNVYFVVLEEISALAVKLGLNALELTGVALSHFVELILHLGDKVVDVLIHQLHGDNIVLVLGM